MLLDALRGGTEPLKQSAARGLSVVLGSHGGPAAWAPQLPQTVGALAQQMREGSSETQEIAVSVMLQVDKIATNARLQNPIFHMQRARTHTYMCGQPARPPACACGRPARTHTCTCGTRCCSDRF